MGSKSKNKKQKYELLVLLATAFIFAVIVGNVIVYLGSDYIVPGINLDVLTFVTVFGYGLTVFILAMILRRRA